MSKPVAIRNIIVEFNVNNIIMLRDALTNYEEYLQNVLFLDAEYRLTKKAIKRRIRYCQDLLEALELHDA